MLWTRDLHAFFDYTIGSTEILVNDVSNGHPSVGIISPLTLVFEVLKYAFAVLLDTLNVAEERVALRLENVRRELTSWRSGGRWRIKGVKHGDTVGLAERLKAHLIDQGLDGVSVGSLYDSWARRDYPTTNTKVYLCIQLLDLSLLFLHVLYPF